MAIPFFLNWRTLLAFLGGCAMVPVVRFLDYSHDEDGPWLGENDKSPKAVFGARSLLIFLNATYCAMLLLLTAVYCDMLLSAVHCAMFLSATYSLPFTAIHCAMLHIYTALYSSLPHCPLRCNL